MTPDQIATGKVTLGDDFNEHRITGFVPHAEARGMDPNLDVPLISHVEGEFWQGGCPTYTSVVLPEGFDFVLSLYPWGAQYILPEGCEREVVTAYDSIGQDPEFATGLAADLSERLDAGQTVLVHCQAGLNRSGLLAARTLILRGDNPTDAVNLLRKQRSPIVLCNETFENWLYSLRAGE